MQRPFWDFYLFGWGGSWHRVPVGLLKTDLMFRGAIMGRFQGRRDSRLKRVRACGMGGRCLRELAVGRIVFR